MLLFNSHDAILSSANWVLQLQDAREELKAATGIYTVLVLDNQGQDATGCRKRTYECLSYTVHRFVSREHFFITS